MGRGEGRAAEGAAHGGKDVNLLVLFIHKILELPDLGLELANALLERLGVAARKGSTTELIAGAAFEADVGALRAGRSDTIAANFLAPASITSLGNAALCTVAHLDDLHGQDSRHDGGPSPSRLADREGDRWRGGVERGSGRGYCRGSEADGKRGTVVGPWLGPRARE